MTSAILEHDTKYLPVRNSRSAPMSEVTLSLAIWNTRASLNRLLIFLENTAFSSLYENNLQNHTTAGGQSFSKVPFWLSVLLNCVVKLYLRQVPISWSRSVVLFFCRNVEILFCFSFFIVKYVVFIDIIDLTLFFYLNL